MLLPSTSGEFIILFVSFFVFFVFEFFLQKINLSEILKLNFLVVVHYNRNGL